MGHTVRARLTLTHVLVALAGVAMVAGLGSVLFSRYYLGQRQAELLAATRKIAALAAPGLAEGNHVELAVLSQAAGAAIGGPVCIFDRHELSPLASNLTAEQSAQRPARPLAPGDARHTVAVVAIACPTGVMYTAAVPVLDPAGGEPLGQVVVRCPIAGPQRIIAAQWTSAGFAAAGAALLAVLLATWLAQQQARPLAELSDSARRLARGEFGIDVAVRGPAELAHLSAALNQAARQLAELFAQQRAARGKLADIIASMAEGVLVYDDRQRVTLVNEPARALLGWTLAPVEGLELRQLVPATDLRQALLCGSDEPLAAPGGTVRTSTARLTSGDETVVVLVDITAEQRLDHMRREFVANASHQLRTPLTSIRGYLEAVTDGTAASDAERARCLGVALDQVGLLQRLVDQLMQLSRLQAGLPAEARETLDLGALAQRAAEHLRPQATARRVDLAVTTPAEAVGTEGVRDLLLQAVHNLLDNAIRHTATGSVVELRVTRCDDAAEVTIADRGPGFTAEQSEAMWERFHAGGPHGRTGLGLAIAKEIIAAHHGEVFAHPRADGGAVFGFRVPSVT